MGFLISWMNLIVNTSDLELVSHEMVDFQDFQCLILKCIEHTFHMLKYIEGITQRNNGL